MKIMLVILFSLTICMGYSQNVQRARDRYKHSIHTGTQQERQQYQQELISLVRSERGNSESVTLVQRGASVEIKPVEVIPDTIWVPVVETNTVTITDTLYIPVIETVDIIVEDTGLYRSIGLGILVLFGIIGSVLWCIYACFDRYLTFTERIERIQNGYN